MLSRLIVTFLCAAAIGSVSGAFLTFDPAPVFLKDIEATIKFSAKLNSKPNEEVTVYFGHPFLSMSTCVIVFNPNNWNVPQQLTGVPAPLFVGSSNPSDGLDFESKLRARAVTVGPLSVELSTRDTLKITQRDTSFHECSIIDVGVNTFDEIPFFFNKPGWYEMTSTRDIKVQVFVSECRAGLSCIKKVLFRYGSSVMSVDVSGPAKDVGEYPVTEVTQNTNGLRHTFNIDFSDHIINFPYGSELYVRVLNNDGIVSLGVRMLLDAGYSSLGGFCNIPRPRSPNNGLIGPDGKLYDPKKKDEVAVFVKSWRVKDADILTNPDARKSIPPTQPGTVCRIPKDPRPKPTTAVVTTTTTTPTTATTPYSASTLPTTTSTTLPYPPVPPAPDKYVPPPPPQPGGYVPPPPPPPPPDVVVEIKKCCQSIFNIPSCNAIVPAEFYIQSCILDAQTSGSYVLSDKVKQTYLAKCRALTDDMILDPTKEVIDQGTKIRNKCGFGNVTCINSCSSKGTCTDFGCACSPGFSGMDCSMDLTKATQYDPSVNQYRINVNVTIVQQQMEQHSKMPGSVPSATSIPSVPYDTPAPSVHSTPSVDKSLASYVGYLPKPSTASPQIAKKSQPAYPKPYDDFQKPILSSAISLGSLRMVSAAAVVITSYILLL
ncbi:hypothetical protein BASA50_003238 [Batrachochytrium salamandrivorans]|uniref:EGF-like domain-containing protein n=1 Tax=Batrachochytrium salamandrivorans TaxID=1357716 RepID=A0ABQ8FJ38_9FUNG|nr:hypothetical protein BASA50_003238 [Batrachochytrium salamandrivorans]